MAEDLRTLREVGIVIADLKTSVDGHFDKLETHVDKRFAVTDKLLYFLGASILAGLYGGYNIYKDIGALQKDVAVIQKEIAFANERIARIPDLANNQDRSQASLMRIEQRLGAASPQPSAPIVLNADEKGLVRAIIAPAADITGAPPTVGIGSVVPPSLALQAMPPELLAKLPKLAGTRYAIDEKSGLILVVAATDNRVVSAV